MDPLKEPKMIKFFKCANPSCGVEFMIHTDHEINEKICGICKQMRDADNYRRSPE